MTCSVTRLTGTATVLRGGAGIPATPGMALRDDDQIVTSANARLGLGCSDGSRFVIGERSSLSLADFESLPEERGPGALLDLIEGILRLALPSEPAWNGFEVRTATAIAAVRSTEWIVEAAPDSTAVFVVEGTVSVSGRAGGQVVLQPGFGTDVPLGAAPTEPNRWGAARVESALARTRLP